MVSPEFNNVLDIMFNDSFMPDQVVCHSQLHYLLIIHTCSKAAITGTGLLLDNYHSGILLRVQNNIFGMKVWVCFPECITM